ncbi:MAG: SBBP repeat-containing protein [Bacteroidales bacterium]
MKQKIYILTMILFSNIVLFGQTPNWVWAKSAGSNYDDDGHSIITDIYGNIYITGDFENSITFGSTTLTSSGGGGIFIAKYDPSGSVLWAKSAVGNGGNYSPIIIADTLGNIYLTGYFDTEFISFGNTTLNNSNNDGGTTDIFIAKYNSSGNIQWAQRAGGLGNDWSNSLISDKNGNIYITGAFNSDTITFGSITLANATTLGYPDIFITKYDSNGNVIWAQRAGGNDYDGSYSIISDANDNIYITGAFYSPSISFGSTILTQTGGGDIYIAKYNSVGNVLWAKSIYGTGNDVSNNISIDTQGNLYFSGYFKNSVITFGDTTLSNIGGSLNIFIAKCDSSGNVLWARNIQGHDWDIGKSCTDKNDNAYLAGFFFNDTITFDNNTFLTNAGGSDIFIAKYDSNGNVIWAKSVGGVNIDGVSSITSDMNGNIFVTGAFFSDFITFGGTTLSNVGGADVFLAKLGSSIGICEIRSENSVVVFPNPTNNSFTLSVPPATKQIHILNSLGQIVQRKIVDRQTSLNFEIKENGIYFIQITTEKQTLTKKIIVTN